MTWRERVDAFPTQLVLTFVWLVVGTPVCIILRQSLLWVSLMSLYTIIGQHFVGHLAWRAKRASESTEGS